MTAATFSVVVPTGGRERYLERALGDLVHQEPPAGGFEVVVVDDGPGGSSGPLVASLARDAPVPIRYVRRARAGVAPARNTGLEASEGEIVAFVDDDCRFPRTWLATLASGIQRAPEADCFGGPIDIALEEPHPRWCGREPFPITYLDHGREDRWVEFVYGANMAVRRAAVARVGAFDPEYPVYGGEELEWILRLRRAGGRVRYVAAARVSHTRLAGDLTLRSLMRLARARGRSRAVFDRRAGTPQPPSRELLRALKMFLHATTHACWGGAAIGVEHVTYAYHAARGDDALS
jgi:GT2 family glycosyltransferase